MAKGLYRSFRDASFALARANQFSAISRLLTSALASGPRNLTKSLWIRRFLDYLQPDNPLPIEEALPPISIAMCVAEKDFRTAKTALELAIASSENPVAETLIAVPTVSVQLAKKYFPKSTIFDERTLIGKRIWEVIQSHHPRGRSGWIIQQVAGMRLVQESKSTASLVIDSDTYLLRKRTFLSSGAKQLLCFSHEFVAQYENHCQQIWGPRKRHHGMSYVTHFQLMQKDILNEIFPTELSVIKWLEAADITLKSPIADYHTYGRWLTENCPNRYEMARWGNISMPWTEIKHVDGTSEIRKRLRTRFPSAFSVSLHEYLDRRQKPQALRVQLLEHKSKGGGILPRP